MESFFPKDLDKFKDLISNNEQIIDIKKTGDYVKKKMSQRDEVHIKDLNFMKKFVET